MLNQKLTREKNVVPILVVYITMPLLYRGSSKACEEFQGKLGILNNPRVSSKEKESFITQVQS